MRDGSTSLSIPNEFLGNMGIGFDEIEGSYQQNWMESDKKSSWNASTCRAMCHSINKAVQLLFVAIKDAERRYKSLKHLEQIAENQSPSSATQ